MACFLVPVAEAVVVTTAAQIVKKSESKKVECKLTDCAVTVEEESVNLPMSRKLMLLSYLLWGGALLLCFEHLWHGEIVPWFPFLTAAQNPEDAALMLHEMSTVGVSMAVIVTGVWGIMMGVVRRMTKKINMTVTNTMIS